LEVPVILRLSEFLLSGLIVATAVLGRDSDAVRNDSPLPQNQSPVLMNACLITSDVPRLVQFYEHALGIPARSTGSEYAEFSTGVGVLAIFSAAAQEKYIPHSAEPRNNKSAILEFKVSDVDREYARLQSIVTTWVKPPTTQPWGTRSIYFRDPDGNLVNFFTPAQTK
jgi:catechol 2,3-dioxygenase-like lactoylglutathione lyase family enzyme